MPNDFTPIPDDFMNVVFGQVYNKLTNGGNPEMLGPNNFVAWEPVASVIDEEAFDFAVKGVFGSPPKDENMTDEAYEDLRASKKWGAYAQAEEFAFLADQIPAFIPKLKGNSREFTVFTPQPGNTVSNVYSDLMDFSVVKDSKIDPKIEKKLERLRKKLFKTKKLKNPDFDDESIEHPEDNPKYIYQSFISSAYTKYLEYEVRYNDAEEILVDLEKRITEGDVEAMTEKAINGRNLLRQRDNALKRWESMGYKGQIEKIMNYIDEIESSNFLTIKKRYESELLASKRTTLGGGNTYYYSSPVPSSILENSRGWTEFEFNKSEYNKVKKRSQHSWSAKASYFGIGKIGNSGKVTNTSSDYNFNDFKMKFKLTKCYLNRGWFSSTFLKSRYWKYSKNGEIVMNNQMISDGNGKGLMPAVVTELYFVKDLEISFKKNSASYKKMQKDIKAGGGFRVGLFNLGAKYNHSSSRSSANIKKEQQGVKSPEILLVGRKCHILNKAPNPLPSIKDSEWIDVN